MVSVVYQDTVLRSPEIFPNPLVDVDATGTTASRNDVVRSSAGQIGVSIYTPASEPFL